MLPQKVILLGDQQSGKLKIVDWGLWALDIPDCTLESSNSTTELNHDHKKRIEQASTSILGKTSPVLFTVRKTPWWNALCRNAVLERRKARKLLEKRPEKSNLKAYQEKTNIAANIIKKQKHKSWEHIYQCLLQKLQ